MDNVVADPLHTISEHFGVI